MLLCFTFKELQDINLSNLSKLFANGEVQQYSGALTIGQLSGKVLDGPGIGLNGLLIYRRQLIVGAVLRDATSRVHSPQGSWTRRHWIPSDCVSRN